MNPAHLHLMLNHLPIVGTAFTLVLLVMGLLTKSEQIKRAGLVFLVLIALLAVPTYLTGEPAEESIQKLAGISGGFIEQHEEAAQTAFIAQIALGVAALIGLLISRRGRPLPNWLAGGLLVLTLAIAGLMARTANLGGQIRHPEIRTSQAPASPAHEKEEH